MKRFLVVLLALALVLQAPASAAHIIFTRNDYEEDSDYTWNYRIAEQDDTLYMFTQLSDHGELSSGYSVLGNVEDPIELFAYEASFDQIHNIFTGNDQIWSYHFLDDLFYINQVVFADDGAASFTEICSYDYAADLGAYFYPLYPIICGDWFLCADWAEGEYARLDVYNMQTGYGDVYDTDDDQYLLNVIGFCPYRDDAVLVASSEYEGKSGVTIYAFYPAEGRFDLLMFLPTEDPWGSIAPAYDANEDKFYYVAMDTLYSITDFNPSTAVVLPDYAGQCATDGVLVQAFVTADGSYLISDGTTLCACSTDPLFAQEQVTPSVSICGNDSYEFVSDACYAYMRENQDAKVVLSTERPTGDGVATDIIAQSDTYDIYMLELHKPDYWALYDRGFLAPMESEKVAGIVERMYPAMQNLMMCDGAVVALPIYYDASCICYNTVAFAELGLTQEDLPTTWMEYLCLLQRMPALVQGTDYTVFEAGFLADSMRSNTATNILHAFQTHFLYDDVAEPAFDNKLMRALLAEFEKIDFHSMGLSEDRDNRLEGYPESAVFFVGLEAGAGRISIKNFAPMPLALDEDMTPVVDGYLTVMVLNPYSKNKNAAISFLETLADYVPSTTQAGISADWVDGVKIEGADQNLAGVDEEIAMIQAEIEAAKNDEEKAQYRQLLDAANEQREWILYRFYWEVSPERLAAYQAYAGNVRIDRYFGMDVSEELLPAVYMYLEGASDMDAMLATLDKKMGLMLGEQ